MKQLSFILPLVLTCIPTLSAIGDNIGPIKPDFPNINKEQIHLTTSIIGPYAIKQKDVISVDIKNDFRVSKEIQLKVFTESTTYGKRIVYYSRPFYLGFDSLYHKDINVDNGYLTSQGLTYHFQILSGDETISYFDKKFTIYPITKQSFDINSLSDRIIKVRQSAYRFLRNSLISIPGEQFNFNNTITTFEEANYYALDISKLKFTYNTNKLPSYGKANLVFKDIGNAFTDLANYRLVNIPLKILQNSNKECYFDFINPLYVDPNTLSLSFKAKPGYIKSNRFYLPRNNAHNLVKYKFTFNLFDVGQARSDIKYELGYSFDSYLLGDCHNSSYCVIGGMDNG